MSSILFGDTMVPIIEKDSILLLVLVFYIRNVILLGLTTKKESDDASLMIAMLMYSL